MATYTIFLDETDSSHSKAVHELARDSTLHWPGLNGAAVAVEPGNHTHVDGPDAIIGALLYSAVCAVVAPRD